MTPNRPWNRAAFRQSERRRSVSPGVLATTALAAFTRPRRSLSLRSSSRSSSSRESSGNPPMMSRSENREGETPSSSSAR